MTKREKHRRKNTEGVPPNVSLTGFPGSHTVY
jgi:hypothetical protein